MDFLSIVGWMVAIGAVVTVVVVVIRFVKAHPDQVAGWKAFLAGLQSRPDPVVTTNSTPTAYPTDAIPASERAEQLEVVRPRQLVTLDGKERVVQAAFTLHELTQKTPKAPWTRKNRKSRVLELAGGKWIFKVPSRNAGKPTWLMMEEVQAPSLMRFYKGTDEAPGPGRKLRLNGQTEPVPYSFPGNVFPGIVWEALDIGAFEVEFDGEGGKSDNFKSGDRVYFVTSQEQGGERRAVFIDARDGEAQGPSGLYVGKPFEPSADVQDLL